jgi:hypothetical protein
MIAKIALKLCKFSRNEIKRCSTDMSSLQNIYSVEITEENDGKT